MEHGALGVDGRHGARTYAELQPDDAGQRRAGPDPQHPARRDVVDVPRAESRADLAHNADPARLAVLEPATRTRLTAKYAQVRALLGLTAGEPTVEQPDPANTAED